MIKYHFSLLLNLCLRCGGTDRGFQSGEDRLIIFFGSRLPQMVVFSPKITLVTERLLPIYIKSFQIPVQFSKILAY